MNLTPINIKTQEFTKSLRGYDANEVNSFLEKVAEEIEILLSENESLKEEIEKLNLKLDNYKKTEKELPTSLSDTHNSSAKSIKNTEKQKEIMRQEAELKAFQIIEKAKQDANEIRNAVIHLREEKDLIIAKLKAIVNTQTTLLEEKVKKIDKAQQEPDKPKQQQPKDDLDVDVDDIVNKLL